MINLSDLIRSFINKRRRPTDIGTITSVGSANANPSHEHDKRRRKRRRHAHHPQNRDHPRIIGNPGGLHLELHPTEGLTFRNGRSQLFHIDNQGAVTHGEGTGSSPGATTADLTAHATDPDAHHNWPLTDGDIPATIARDSELTSQIATHAADDDAHHEPVSLTAAVSTIFSLIGPGLQQLSLDNQSANVGLFGPASGPAATPTFRALVAADIPANSIDDTKAGPRLPQFYRRQGGSATDWSSAGTTTYTPGAVRLQAGSIGLNGVSGGNTQAVTFPVAFSNPPLVFLTIEPDDAANADRGVFQVTVDNGSISATGFTIRSQEIIAEVSPETPQDYLVFWLALGPE